MKKFWVVVGGLIIFTKLTFAEWHITKIDSIGNVGKYTSLCYVFDEGYLVSASYYDETNGNLKFINNVDIWINTPLIIVDSSGDVGKFTSIYSWKGSAGIKNILISYYDETNGNLKCAWSKSTSFSGDTTFELFTIDSIGDVGLYTSLYVDTLHKVPYISYYDATNGDLKLAYFKDSIWSIQKIDTAGDVGKYNSITGYFDTLYISYYDSTNRDLKSAEYNGTNWQIEKIDTTGDVGKYSSILSIGYSYYKTISYYDITNGNLKEAEYYLNNWNISTRDTAGDVGMFCHNTNPYGGRLFYYDKTNGNLKSTIGGIVDSSGDVGGYSSSISCAEITLIIYYDFTNRDLKRAWTGGTVEERTTVNRQKLIIHVSPNPFTSTTVISYSKILNGESKTSINIYDIAGKLVKSFPITQLSNNQINSLTWDGKDDNGRLTKSGIYFVKVNSGTFETTKKITLIR